MAESSSAQDDNISQVKVVSLLNKYSIDSCCSVTIISND